MSERMNKKEKSSQINRKKVKIEKKYCKFIDQCDVLDF